VLLCIFPENFNSLQQELFELVIRESSNWTAGHSSAHQTWGDYSTNV